MVRLIANNQTKRWSIVWVLTPALLHDLIPGQKLNKEAFTLYLQRVFTVARAARLTPPGGRYTIKVLTNKKCVTQRVSRNVKIFW